MTDENVDFGVQKLASTGVGPFECRQPGGRKDADLAALDGENTPEPVARGHEARESPLHEAREQETYNQIDPLAPTFGGYSGTGQRPVQDAKEA